MTLILNNIKNFVRNMFYGLFFGMKSADNEILGPKNGNSNPDTQISQKVEDKTVAKHLINGEITEAVEELRYRTYKVEEESENYEYIGDGIAVKKEVTKRPRNKIKFTQPNRFLVSNVLAELERLDNYGVDNYLIEMQYTSPTRFKYEAFVDRIQVDCNLKKTDYKTTLYFSTIPNPQNPLSKAFINEIKKIEGIDLNSDYAKTKHEVLSLINVIAFSTYRASGEKNFVNYAFLGPCTVESVEFNEHECKITYKWSEMMRRVPEKLSEKYKSESMAEKYENHLPKEVDNTAQPLVKDKYCEVCGKKITSADKSTVICDECINKLNQNQQ